MRVLFFREKRNGRGKTIVWETRKSRRDLISPRREKYSRALKKNKFFFSFPNNNNNNKRAGGKDIYSPPFEIFK
jgi:hypothetical protein